MNRRRAFLVELKTDMGSKGGDQEKYLRRARDIGLEPLVDGIVEICGSKGCKIPQKYVHLLHLLAELELVTIPNPGKLYQITCPDRRRGWTEAFRGVKPAVDGKLKDTRVVFIQPTEDKPGSSVTGSGGDFTHIYFRDVAEIVQRFGDRHPRPVLRAPGRAGSDPGPASAAPAAPACGDHRRRQAAALYWARSITTLRRLPDRRNGSD